MRAGIAGVLQELPVQVGQRVTPGTMLAKVVQPENLKAELRIAETQAKDVSSASALDRHAQRRHPRPCDPHRLPPSQDGTVTVDVKLEGALPPGARPDLSVDGTIELERLTNVVYVGRPAFGQPDSTVELFKLRRRRQGGDRVPVKLGRARSTRSRFVSGLRPATRSFSRTCRSGTATTGSAWTNWNQGNRLRNQGGIR